MQYILLVILWIAWCTLHSVLISQTVTEALRKRFPGGFRFYRIFYNLFAVASLLPVLFYNFSVSGEMIVTWNGLWGIFPILLWGGSLVLFVAGARRYDFLRFIGIRQIRSQETCSVLTADCSLDTNGVLSLVRHPWYSAGILIIWARPLDLAAILTNLVVSGYFMVGAILEERKLKVQFGQQYTDYRQQVSMLFPVKWVQQQFFRRN